MTDPTQSQTVAATIQGAGGAILGKPISLFTFGDVSKGSFSDVLVPLARFSCGSESSLAGSCTKSLTAGGTVSADPYTWTFSDTAVSSVDDVSAGGGTVTGTAAGSIEYDVEGDPQPPGIDTGAELTSSYGANIAIKIFQTATVTLGGTLSGTSAFDSGTAGVSLGSFQARKRSGDALVPIGGSVTLAPGSYTLSVSANAQCTQPGARSATAIVTFSIQ